MPNLKFKLIFFVFLFLGLFFWAGFSSAVSFLETLSKQIIATDGYCQTAFNLKGSGPAFGDNKTYVAYMDNSGSSTCGGEAGAHNIFVRQYDYLTGLWSSSPILGSVNPACCDGHDSPVIYRSLNGYLTVIYGAITAGKNSSGVLQNGPFYRRSTNPDDITSWGVEQRIPDLGGFSENIGGYSSNGSLHVLGQQQWGSATTPGFDLIYARQNLDLSWSGPNALIHDDGKDDAAGSPNKVGPCLFSSKIVGSTIYLIWASTTDGCSGGGQNLYYAKSTDNGETWTNVNSTASFSRLAGLAATAASTYPSAYLVKAGSVTSDMEVNVASDGRPFVIFRETGLAMYKWNGSSWTKVVLDSTMTGGIWGIATEVLSDGRITVFGSDGDNIYQYLSSDLGSSWGKSTLASRGSADAVKFTQSFKAQPPGQQERVLLQWIEVRNAASSRPAYHTEIAFLDKPYGIISPVSPTPTPIPTPTPTPTSSGAGNIYYVSTTGNDANSCTAAQSISAPKRTINASLACLSGGDTLVINDSGTYSEGIDCSILNCPNGSASASTIIRGANSSARPTLIPPSSTFGIRFYDNSYITLQDVKVDANNVSSAAIINTGNIGSNHITIRNVEIYNIAADDTGAITSNYGSGYLSYYNNYLHGFKPGNRSGGIYLNNSNAIAEGNTIDGPKWWGIQIYRGGTSPLPSNNIIRTNLIKNCGPTTSDPHTGISVAEGDGNLAYNNIINGCGYGAYIRGTNTKFYNNTIYGNTFSSAFPSGGGEAKNNIFRDFTPSTSGGWVLSNNLMPSTNPQFVNVSAGDFHLQSTSPAINAGATLAEVTTDFDGISRPQGSGYDIGAYEFSGPTPTPTPTPTPSPTPIPTTIVFCDLNQDNSTNILDLQHLANVILGKSTCSGNCDINKDGSVNILDLQYLANVILGKSVCT